MSKAQDMLNRWGEKRLESYGLTFDPGSVKVYEDTFHDGYCETCYTTWTGLRIDYRVEGHYATEPTYESTFDVIAEALEGDDND